VGGLSPVGFLQHLCRSDAHGIELPVLLVAAHPDDEVIGAGTRLPRLRGVHIAYVTDGAPLDMRDATRLGFRSRDTYAEARAREASAGLALVDVDPARVHRLGLVDQAASLRMAELTRTLLGLIHATGPRVVLTHAYEAGHPDHDATALAVHLACRLIHDAGLEPPMVVEFAGYHDADGSGRLAALEFLPADTPSVTVELSEAEQALKRRLVACHATQAEVLRQFPLDRERFRLAPAYDFLAPPHPWRPFYEHFVAGMDGVRWRHLAAGTLAGFGVAGPI
jgi:LmbE family N-acetylglucosaminyl deacetylase